MLSVFTHSVEECVFLHQAVYLIQVELQHIFTKTHHVPVMEIPLFITKPPFVSLFITPQYMLHNG